MKTLWPVHWLFFLILALGYEPTINANSQPISVGHYLFPATKFKVRYLLHIDGTTEIQAFDSNLGSVRSLYRGKLKTLGVTGTFQDNFGLKMDHHTAQTYTYAITDQKELLLILDRGQLIRSPKITSDLTFAKGRTLSSIMGEFSVLCLNFNGDFGTYLFQHDSGRLIKVSSRQLNDKELSEVEIDDYQREIFIPGVDRELDLDRLDFEELFEPRPTQKVLTKDGGTVKPLEFLDEILMDLRAAAMDPPIQYTEKDAAVVKRVVEGLKRKDAKAVILLGQSGTGKTTLIEGILDHIPRTWRVYLVPREALEQGGAYVGEIEKRVNAMVQASRMAPIIFVFDEFHTLKGAGTHSGNSVDVLQQMKRYVSSGEMMVIATDTPEEYQRAFGADPALRRRFTEIRVEEPRNGELLQKLKFWLATKTKIKVDEGLMMRAVSLSRDLDPGAHEPARSIHLLEQLLSDVERAKKETVDPKDLDRSAWNLYGIGPEEPLEFIKNNELRRSILHSRVVDQPHFVNAMVDLWREVNLGASPKKHRSILVVGPTGAGKSFGGKGFAEIVLQDPERFLEIDATKYRNGNFDSLIGTARYHAESPQGLLPEFLSGRGKGRNVIVINEIEKAHPDLIKILMEMLDTGKLQGGDGRTYYLGRSLIVFTSNRGADEVFPVGSGAALSQSELEKRLATFTDKRVRDLFLKPSSKNLYDSSEVWGAAELQRIDRAVAVPPPSIEGAIKIVADYVNHVLEALRDQHFYSLEIERSILEAIVRAYYIPEEGVRSLLQRAEDMVNFVHQEVVLAFKPQPKDRMMISRAASKDPTILQLRLNHQASGKQVPTQFPIRRTGELSPLSDPSGLSRLQGLEVELAKRVFGQDEALRIVSRSVRTRALNPQTKTPANALLLGSTGNGKTETGRALADILFGSSKRLRVFSMGGIKSEHDWSNIFGSARGIVGSETMSPFEKALHDFPEGMVIVLDEIGNMGMDPTNPRAGLGLPREELLKRLYEMFEEGTWTSPLGKVYDLRKHFILMTSNEGQEFFMNLPSDDLRMSEWKRTNRREILQELLLKHGWPEPLLGRIGNNITMMKPLLKSEQTLVAQKEMEKVFKQLLAGYEVAGIQVAEGFYERLADAFFSHSRGARSLREVAEGAVVDLFGQAVIESVMDQDRLKASTFVLDIEDSFAGRFRRQASDKTERIVTLRMTVISPSGEQKVYESNLAREAKPKRLVTMVQAQITAYHEAGHAIVNDPSRTGENVDFITIRGEGGYGGYVRYERDGSLMTLSRDSIIARIARVLAGQLAQEMAGFPKDSGWQSDLEHARKIAEQAISTWGLTDEALKLPVEDGKVILDHPRVQKEIVKLVEEGRVECDRILRDRWVQIRLLSIRLMRDGHLDREHYDEFLKKASLDAPRKIEELRSRLTKNTMGLSKRWACMNSILAIALIGN